MADSDKKASLIENDGGDIRVNSATSIVSDHDNEMYSEGDVGFRQAQADVRHILEEIGREEEHSLAVMFPQKLPEQPSRSNKPKTLRHRHVSTSGKRSQEVSSLPNIPKLPQNELQKQSISVPTIPSKKMGKLEILNRRMKPKEEEINLNSSDDVENKSSLLAELPSEQSPTPRQANIITPLKSTFVDPWKSDLRYATFIRQSPKAEDKFEDAMKLRYKDPIWPHQQPLHQILSRVPKLTCLILDGSELMWLRDLGSQLPSLVTLSVANCGLSSLDGLFAFPTLKTLIAADNKISHPSQCSSLIELRYLDLSGNPIVNFEGFVHLLHCVNIRGLRLNATRVSKFKNFHIEMRRLIPQLKELSPKSPQKHENNGQNLDSLLPITLKEEMDDIDKVLEKQSADCPSNTYEKSVKLPQSSLSVKKPQVMESSSKMVLKDDGHNPLKDAEDMETSSMDVQEEVGSSRESCISSSTSIWSSMNTESHEKPTTVTGVSSDYNEN